MKTNFPRKSLDRFLSEVRNILNHDLDTFDAHNSVNMNYEILEKVLVDSHKIAFFIQKCSLQ